MATPFRIHKGTINELKGWTKTTPIVGNMITDMADTVGTFENAKFATSMPSPFARMHLFETAFNFVNDNKDKTMNDTPYHRFVSECLDMFELIFYMGNNPTKIKYKVWNTNQVNPNTLPKSNIITQSANLSDALHTFLQSNRFKAMTSIILIYYVDATGEEKLVGGTSPLTYFYVSPNWDTNNIATTGKDILFEKGKSKPLSQRNDDFKQYMRRFFVNNGVALKNQMLELYNYLDTTFSIHTTNPLDGNAVIPIQFGHTAMDCCGITYEGINPTNTQKAIEAGSDFVIDTKKPITGYRPLVLAQGQGVGNTYLPATQWQNSPRLIDHGGINHYPLINRILPDSGGINYPYLTTGDFLQTSLIKLPFSIDKTKFMVGARNENVDIDFLLPIKPEYFDYFTLQDLDNQLFIQKNNDNTVSISLKIPIRDGKEIILKQEYKGEHILDERLNIGIYPFYKITDQVNQNRYAIKLTSRKAKEFSLHFKKTEGIFNQSAITYDETRTQIPNYAASHAYLVKGDYFDAIQIEKEGSIRGMIFPKFIERKNGVTNFTFAIDFGTTNTFVAYSSGTDAPKPLELTGIEGIEPIFLNANANYGDFIESKRLDNREFPPSEATPTTMATYPIRTATVELENFLKGATPKVLGNIGIGYLLEGEEDLSVDHANYTTNLKWLFETAADERADDKIQAFFEQVLWAIKNKVVTSNGNLNNIKIFWLTPKSMKERFRNQFKNLWEVAFNNVFSSSDFSTVMQHRSESTAPYLALLGTGWTAPNTNAVNIDIGGGTTDVIFIIPSRNENYITSFRFAGDDIWGETEWGTITQKNNGFRKYIEQKMLSSVRTNSPLIGNYYDLSSKTRNSSDLMSLVFKHKEFRASNSISQNGKLKAVLFLHYAAIIYHIVQFMELKEVDKLGRISLTGKGSLYLEMLGSDASISEITKSMVELFSSSKEENTEQDKEQNTEENTKQEKNHQINAKGLEVIKHSNPKEVTANGVIYQHVDVAIDFDENNLKNDMLSGTKKPTSLKIDEYQNESFENLNKRKEEVFENVKRFITLLTQDRAIKAQCDNLGIEISIFNDTEHFMQTAKESFGNMSIRRGYGRNPQDEVDETLFFWALKQPIYEYAQ